MANTSKEYKLAVKIAGSVSSSFNSAMGGAEKRIHSLGSVAAKAAAVAGAAWGALKIGQFFTDAAGTYTEFEQAMANTAAISGATADEYKALQDAAMEMGKATTKTATECADALGYMSLAGWDVSESVASLEPVLRLSEATQMDLATCSDLVTDSMSALGLQVSDLAMYLDLATMANNKSNTTSQAFMEAMIGCGGAAKTLGSSLVDTGTAAGVLANNGTKGAEAGTALNSIFARIASNDQAISALDKLGVSAFDASGEFIGLREFLVQTQGALANLSTEERAFYLKRIAGTNYFTEMSYLLDSVKEGANGTASAWDNLSSSLGNSEGALMTMAETVTDTWQAAKERFKSAIDDLKINIVSSFAPYAKEAFNSLSEAIPGVTEKVTALGVSFVEYVLPRIHAFGEAVRPAVEKVGTALHTIGGAIIRNKETFDKLGRAAAAAINLFADAIEAATPLLTKLIDAAMSMIGKAADLTTKALEYKNALKLIVAVWAAWKVGGTIRKMVTGFQAGTKALELFGKAHSGVSVLEGILTGKLGKNATMVALLTKQTTLAQIATGKFKAITTVLSGGLTTAKGVMVGAFKSIGAGLAGIKTAAAGLFATLAANPVTWIVVGIVAVVAALVVLYKKCEWFRNGVNSVIKKVVASLQAFWQKAKAVFTGVWESIKSAWDKIKPYAEAIWTGIIAVIVSAWDKIKAAAAVVVEFFQTSVLPRIRSIMDSVAAAFKAAWELIKTIWEKVAPFFAAIWEAIKAIFSVAAQVLGGFFRVAWEAIKGIWAVASPFFKAIWENIKAVFSVVGAVLGGFFRTAWEAIKAIWNTVAGYFQAVWDTIAGIFSVAKAVLSGDFSGAWEAIKGIFSTWGDFFSGLWDSVTSVFGAAADWFSGVFSAVWDGIKGAFHNGLEAIKTSVHNGFSTINSWTGGKLSEMVDWVKNAWENIKNAVSMGLQFIQELIGAAFQLITLPFRFIWENCKETVTAAWQGMKDTISGALTSIKTAITEKWEAAKAVVGNVTSAISEKVTSAWSTVKSSTSAAYEAVKGHITEKLSAAKAAAEPVITSIKNTASTAWSAVSSATSTAWSAVKNTTASAFESVRSSISSKITSAKNAVDSAVGGLRDSIRNGLTSAKNTVTSIFGSIYNAIHSKMESAKNAVQNAINALKAKFNFSWSLPKLKLPHISITGKFSLKPPSVPHFGISWYKQGGILDGAQIFGAAGGKLLGGGEAGKEAVLPLSELWTQLKGILTSAMQSAAAAGSGAAGSGMRAIADKLTAAATGRGVPSISDILDMLRGPAPQPAPAGGPPIPPGGGYTILYNPTYQFNGPAPSKEDMVEASRISQDEFNEMMDKWQHDNDRKDF